ncbi:hypothetical protein BpHYR1_029039 [Brachionus plicatilis]|uniref:Uncharacterized protein n=1 Tax=Brachionus plicatilis TaxID=10195 RepID=A0A3M7RZP9_BRAPC|nr:hypothetical protein BpHYR1_029039 [Brachionus plicatilis]
MGIFADGLKNIKFESGHMKFLGIVNIKYKLNKISLFLVRNLFFKKKDKNFIFGQKGEINLPKNEEFLFNLYLKFTTPIFSVPVKVLTFMTIQVTL